MPHALRVDGLPLTELAPPAFLSIWPQPAPPKTTNRTARRIEYYPPRGDAKEGWDNIDIVGWLGQPMQIKIDFLCRNSILSAPMMLDLILFLDSTQLEDEDGYARGHRSRLVG